MIPEELYDRIPINRWNDLNTIWEEKFVSPEQQWIFRGQRKFGEWDPWDLQTSIERVTLKFEVTGNMMPPKNNPKSHRDEVAKLHRSILQKGLVGREGTISMLKYEGGLLRRFKRQCYHYIMDTPTAKNYIEWFALMRHHGAPTRLLDWTYSLFVAIYFAIEESDEEFVVWALNSNELKEPSEAILNEVKTKGDAKALACWLKDRDITKPETFRKLFIRKAPITFVAAVNPYRLNERLVRQQGVFLCPGDVSKPFEDNFLAVLLKCPKPKECLIKLEFGKDIDKRKFINRLRRMNINRATLFPGIDGFAQSLNMAAAFPDILTPDDDWLTEIP